MVLQFPDDYPDTPACKAMEEATQAELQAKYSRMPPAKRPNYVKMAVASPFRCPWSQLVDEWHKRALALPQRHEDSVSDGHPRTVPTIYTVLRCRKSLAQVASAISGGGVKPKGAASSSETLDAAMVAESQVDVVFREILAAHPYCLVPVYLKCPLRGTPDDFSMICIPSLDDLQSLARDPRYGGPIEPLRKGNKNSRKKGCSQTQSVKPGDLSTTLAVDAEMTECDSEQKGSKRACSRVIIGYVKHGGFTFTTGHGCGIGFVALPGLAQLVCQTAKTLKVLVRSPASRQYRFAGISVIS